MSAKGGFAIGPSHKNGGIKMKVKSTGQQIEIEGGEPIINKTSAADDNEYIVKGTPIQIASLINEIDGNGVNFADTSDAEILKLKHGGLIKNGVDYNCPFETLFFIKI